MDLKTWANTLVAWPVLEPAGDADYLSQDTEAFRVAFARKLETRLQALVGDEQGWGHRTLPRTTVATLVLAMQPWERLALGAEMGCCWSLGQIAGSAQLRAEVKWQVHIQTCPKCLEKLTCDESSLLYLFAEKVEAW